jgi:hypothetical protein
MQRKNLLWTRLFLSLSFFCVFEALGHAGAGARGPVDSTKAKKQAFDSESREKHIKRALDV